MLEGHERTLVAAEGYSELGMFDDALAELDSLPTEAQQNSSVIERRTVILMQAKRWKPALAASQDLCKVEPAKTSGFIHAAFCLHELGRTLEARDTLLSGPDALHAEPTFHYNLACYECALGHLDLARMHLDKSIELDKKMRDFARTDPDLAALHEDE
jgi:predicted Zn-dependent protease